jgi:hypothetical protein
MRGTELYAEAVVERLQGFIEEENLSDTIKLEVLRDSHMMYSAERGAEWVEYISAINLHTRELRRVWNRTASDPSAFDTAQWEEMQCFVLQHTGNGCLYSHKHVIPEDWRTR